MSKPTTNKPARDWHHWDIKAALGKKGYSLKRVSLENSYNMAAASDTLRRPWPAIERIIADIIGEEPWNIWSSRYDGDNKPLHGQPQPQ